MPAQTVSFPFIDKAYVDAKELLLDTRDFAENGATNCHLYSDPKQKMLVVSETTRLVSHVVNAMSWLLLNKAAENGEISKDLATEKCQCHIGEEIFSERKFEIDFDLPRNLSKLMSRSDRLHERLDRIHNQIFTTG